MIDIVESMDYDARHMYIITNLACDMNDSFYAMWVKHRKSRKENGNFKKDYVERNDYGMSVMVGQFNIITRFIILDVSIEKILESLD